MPPLVWQTDEGVKSCPGTRAKGIACLRGGPDGHGRDGDAAALPELHHAPKPNGPRVDAAGANPTRGAVSATAADLRTDGIAFHSERWRLNVGHVGHAVKRLMWSDREGSCSSSDWIHHPESSVEAKSVWRRTPQQDSRGARGALGASGRDTGEGRLAEGRTHPTADARR